MAVPQRGTSSRAAWQGGFANQRRAQARKSGRLVGAPFFTSPSTAISLTGSAKRHSATTKAWLLSLSGEWFECSVVRQDNRLI